MYEKNPLSPHLQIYKWHISSFLSITHRIVGVINAIAITLICFFVIFLFFGETNFESFKIILQSFIGKILIIMLCWSFSYHALNEIRHLVWDFGYGYDLRISRITGVIIIIGSFVLPASIYFIGKNFI
jgi:succinate dehydrogenase / fumarate reductase cytochrome b subunit